MTGRRVYFSFHYKGDVWRATIVRKAGAINDRVQGGWVDASLWEETKRAGPDAVQALIEDGLNGTSVTVVLIGAETAERPWVKYEIKRSIERGNGLIGVRIHSLRDQEGHRGWLNPPRAPANAGSGQPRLPLESTGVRRPSRASGDQSWQTLSRPQEERLQALQVYRPNLVSDRYGGNPTPCACCTAPTVAWWSHRRRIMKTTKRIEHGKGESIR